MAFDASYRSPQETSNYVSYQDAEAKDQTLRDAVLRSRQQAETHATDMQMNRQKIAENDITLQERQQDLKDQQIGKQSFMDGQGDMDKVLSLMMQRGASPKAVSALQTHMADVNMKLAQKREVDLKNHAAVTQSIGSAMDNLLSKTDEAQRAIQWPDTRADLLSQGVPAEEVPEQYPGADWATMHRNDAVSVNQAVQNALKVKEVAAAEKNAAARAQAAETGAATAAAELPGKKADAAQKARADNAARLLAMTPEDQQAEINKMPYGEARLFAPALAIADPAQRAAAIRQVGMTAEQQTQAGQAAANAAQTKKNEDAHLKIAQEDLELKRKTFNLNQENSKNLGLQGVPPHLIGPATAAYEKAGLEFATASSAADTMQSVLDLAEKGNKAAGSNLPLVGVETLNAINGIKRINGAEIAQYGSAGSLLDQLKGKLGKLTAGQPIPQDVLDDIRALHTEIAKQAGTTYERKVQTTNKTYGSQFKPVEFAPAKAAAAPAHVIDVGGKRYQYNGTGDTADLKNYTEVKKQQ